MAYLSQHVTEELGTLTLERTKFLIRLWAHLQAIDSASWADAADAYARFAKVYAERDKHWSAETLEAVQHYPTNMRDQRHATYVEPLLYFAGKFATAPIVGVSLMYYESCNDYGLEAIGGAEVFGYDYDEVTDNWRDYLEPRD